MGYLKQRNFVSHRDLPLSWIWEPLENHTVVCVEVYMKWYGLHLIRPNGEVERVPFPDDYAESGETPFLDHAPNPTTVQRWAKRNNYVVCDIARELMIGRWELEYHEHYQEPD